MACRSAALAVLILASVVHVATADDATSQPTRATTVPAGYRPHITSGPGGKIDWANGLLLVEGIGKARGTDEQQQKMAERAATVVAARNALSLAAGVQVNRYGRFSDLRDGTVQIEGMIKGHFAVAVNWDPKATPPTCKITLGVPMWGIKGLSAIVFEEERKRSRSAAHMPIVESDDARIGEGEFIVIDARGTQLRPCMFPIVINADGRVLYDVSVRSQYHGEILQTVRYVEVDPLSAPTPATSKPSQSESSELHHFKIQPLSRLSRTDIVLGRGDVRTIARNPKLVSLLRAGRMLVVLDPATDRED